MSVPWFVELDLGFLSVRILWVNKSDSHGWPSSLELFTDYRNVIVELGLAAITDLLISQLLAHMQFGSVLYLNIIESVVNIKGGIVDPRNERNCLLHKWREYFFTMDPGERW